MTMRTDDRGSGLAGILTLLAAFIGTAVVAGLIGAGLFMPTVGAAGATARTGVDFFDALPTEFEQSPLAQQSRILDAEGHVIATFYDENRIVVPLAKVSKTMQAAQIAIEDNRFREHGGIDPKGVVRAAVTNAKSGGSAQGASTLTQQFVKLTLQENALAAGDAAGAQAAVNKNFGRKIQEMKYAITLEKKMSKDQILEGYLNIAYYGDGAYGVETAARHYFSTTAAKLTLPQAALLAGLVQSPAPYDPRKHPKAALGRRNIVLSRMLETNVITQKQYNAAKKSKLGLKVSPAGNGCEASKYAYFCDYVYAQLKAGKAFGANKSLRVGLLLRGGLTIKTSIEPSIQDKAQKAVSGKVTLVNKSHVAAAMSVVQPGTGKVLAMVQSSRFGNNKKKGETKVNYNTDHAYGNSGGFQPGSTFKAITLAAAIEDGKALSDQVDTPKGGTVFPASDFNTSACWPSNIADRGYAPQNAEHGEEAGGKLPLWKATADSVNTAFVSLEGEIGPCKVKSMADRLGMHGAVKNKKFLENIPNAQATDEIRPQGSMTLGAQEAAPLTVAAAYAAFAADGMYCAPISIISASTLTGKSINVPKPDCSQAMDKDVARGVTSALEGVISHGTASRVEKIQRPAAGKTGTSNRSQATWFTGYVPQLAASVWFGKPNGYPHNEYLRNIDTGKRKYPGQIYGATVAAPIWAAFMKSAVKGLPVENFGESSYKILHGDRVTVPSVTGQAIDDARRALEGAGFTVRIGDPKPSAIPQGLVAETNPGAGSRVSSGASITIYPSTGTPVTTPTIPTPTFTKLPGGNHPTPKPTKTRHPR